MIQRIKFKRFCKRVGLLPTQELYEAFKERNTMGARTCIDCGKDVESMSVHSHVLIHRKLGI